jgi:Na+/H+ antiporter NhaD/arsenite permease-like protein
MNLLALAVFAGTFVALAVRQVVGRGPRIWMVLLLGGAVTVLVGILSPSAAAGTVTSELPVLVFLASLFVLVAALERSGAFEHLARWAMGRARRPEDLVFFLFVGFGLLSAVVLNDALVLVGVPLVFGVARRLSADARPLLYVVAYSVTVGSVLTPLGNPQNLLVALDSGLRTPIVAFLRYLALPTLLSLLVGGWYLRGSYRAEFRGLPPPAEEAFLRPPLFPRGGWRVRLLRAPVLVIFPLVLVLVVGLDVGAAVTGATPVPTYAVAGVGALVVLALSSARGALVRRVDWGILLLFVGLFVVVGGAVAGGLLGGLDRLLPVPGPSASPAVSVGAILGTSLLGSQLVSNVPWVALQIPVLHSVGYGASTPLAWVALAAGSTLAGNLTLLGAASNLIVVEQAEQRSVRISLAAFARRGLPLAALSTAILFGCLLVGL